jgi:hypothetical protein
LGIQEEEFNEKIDHFNLRLSHFMEEPRQHFWDLSTLQGVFSGMDQIGGDGVHLNSVGLRKYYRELRGIIVKYSYWVHNEWGYVWY